MANFSVGRVATAEQHSRAGDGLHHLSQAGSQPDQCGILNP
jgi:hypothetical protein